MKKTALLLMMLAAGLVVAPRLLRAATIYDFEAGADGWGPNTSPIDSRNNFDTPVLSGAHVHQGANSLALPLDFTDQETYGVKDWVSIYHPPQQDYSAETGFTLYVYVDQTAFNGNPSYPLQAVLFVKTGVGEVWYQGALKDLARNQWNKLTLDFNNGFTSDKTPVSVPDRDQIREIGLFISSAKYDIGATTLYLDNVQTGLGDDAAPPSAPAGASAANPGTGNQVNVSWTAVADGALDHYNIYRGFSPPVISTITFVGAAPAGQTTFSDDSVVDGFTYFYKVTAVDKSGNESAAASASATPSGPAGYTPQHKGISFASYQPDQFSGFDSKSSLDDLKGTGANIVALVVTRYMQNATANTIDVHPTKTATDPAVVQAIADIHARGMKVMLKPHVDVVDDSWRGSIAPSNEALWFSNYAAFVSHYAQIAAANGVEYFCIGTELKTMTDHKRAQWLNVITAARTAAAGVPLVYAANATRIDDEFAQVNFWDQLDYVGFNLYFPLTNSAGATVNAMKQAWSRTKDDVNILKALSNWHNLTGKPVLVTETGYQSVDGTNVVPYGTGGAVDLAEQSDAYEAAFAALNHKPWLNGIFWWGWDPNQNAGGSQDQSYSPQNKPAQDILKTWYGGETVRDFYDFAGGTQGWQADTTAFFLDNLGPPTTEVVSGNAALRYPLNLDNKSGGIIKDFAFVDAVVPKNLGGYKGITMRVRIPAGANINNSGPATVAVVVQTGDAYDWYQSNSYRNLTPGQWRDISLDFSSAESFANSGAPTGKGQPVLHTDSIRRIAINVTGASAGSGSTFFYVDDIETTGTGNILGVSIGPGGGGYSFNGARPLQSTVTASAILIENSGNVPVRYSLNAGPSSISGWQPAASAGAGTYLLNAQFNSSQPGSFGANHVVGASPVFSSATQFAGPTELGINVSPSGTRHLWFELVPPSVSSLQDLQAQTITVTVTGEMQ